MNRLLQLVSIIRLTVFCAKHLKRALKLFAARRGRQANHQRVEILKERAILAKNGTMGLIDDHQVKTPNTKVARVLVDFLNHRLIRREDDSSIQITVEAAARNNRRRYIGQQLRKVFMGLTNETRSVSQKQNVLYPAAPQQNVNKGDGDTGLTRAGSHDHDASAAAVHECIAGVLNCFLLIITIGNRVVNHRIGDVGPRVNALFK